MATITLSSKKQFIGFNKKDMYVTKAVRYSTISEKDLVEHASQDSGVPRAMMKAAFEALTQQAKELMLNGHSISLGSLGTLRFSVSCKTVATKEEVNADLVKTRRVLFRPSKELRDDIENVKFETEVIPEPSL